MKRKKPLVSPSLQSSVYGLGKAYGERSFNSAHVTEFSFKMSEHEPVVELLVGGSAAFCAALKKDGRPVPPPVKLRALIDTGFEGGMMLDQASVKTFGLKPKNFCHMVYASGPNRGYDVYTWETDVSVTFLNSSKEGSNVLIDPMPATLIEFVDAGKGVQALIGQEILQVCVFTYDGKRGIFKLTF